MLAGGKEKYLVLFLVLRISAFTMGSTMTNFLGKARNESFCLQKQSTWDAKMANHSKLMKLLLELSEIEYENSQSHVIGQDLLYTAYKERKHLFEENEMDKAADLLESCVKKLEISLEYASLRLIEEELYEQVAQTYYGLKHLFEHFRHHKSRVYERVFKPVLEGEDFLDSLDEIGEETTKLFENVGDESVPKNEISSFNVKDSFRSKYSITIIPLNYEESIPQTVSSSTRSSRSTGLLVPTIV